MLIIISSFPRYLFYGIPHTLSRINLNGIEKNKIQFNISIYYFSIKIDYLKRKIFLHGNNLNGKNIIMSMDYDGRDLKNILETKLKTDALAVFGDILYWQEPNNSVVNVMNVTTLDTYRNISLPRQWSSLTGLTVINYFPDPICKQVSIFIFIVPLNVKPVSAVRGIIYFIITR